MVPPVSRKRAQIRTNYQRWTARLSPSERDRLSRAYRGLRKHPGPDRRGLDAYAKTLGMSRMAMVQKVAQLAQGKNAVRTKRLGFGPLLSLVRRYFGRINNSPLGRLSVLDVGMGQGNFLKELQRELHGVRFSLSGISLKRIRPVDGVRQLVGPIEKKNWREKFDLIVSVNTLAYSPHPRLAVASIAKALKPGGTAILHVPFFDGDEKKLGTNRLGVSFAYSAKNHVLVLTKNRR